MDKTITTALLIVISMVTALMLFNAAYPAVIEGGDAITGMTDQFRERMRTQIDIIHAAGEMDSSGVFRDSNSNNQFEVFLWVKNTGLTRINAVTSLDVFFGPEGQFVRIPHQSQAGGASVFWSTDLAADDAWDPTETLRITLRYSSNPGQGRYFAKVTLPTGDEAEYYLGM